jgi:hypothetical protein
MSNQRRQIKRTTQTRYDKFLWELSHTLLNLSMAVRAEQEALAHFSQSFFQRPARTGIRYRHHFRLRINVVEVQSLQ